MLLLAVAALSFEIHLDERELSYLEVEVPNPEVVANPNAKTTVLIYYFFDPKGRESLKHVPIIEKFYRQSLAKDTMKFQAVLVRQSSPEEIELFRKRTSSTFPIIYKEHLVKGFVIWRSPTVLLLDVRRVKSQFITKGGIRYDKILSRIEKIYRPKSADLSEGLDGRGFEEIQRKIQSVLAEADSGLYAG